MIWVNFGRMFEKNAGPYAPRLGLIAQAVTSSNRSESLQFFYMGNDAGYVRIGTRGKDSRKENRNEDNHA